MRGTRVRLATGAGKNSTFESAILELAALSQLRTKDAHMQQQTSIFLNISGIANGSYISNSQPTALIDHLPFGAWTTLAQPVVATGRIIGVASPQSYEIALFAVEAQDQIWGDIAWLVPVSADGTFQITLSQAASEYIAILMTPTFAQHFFDDTLPNGNGAIDQLPLPATYPGDVLLVASIPAGLNRSLQAQQLSFIPILKPGECWVNTDNAYISGTLRSYSTSNGLPDPNDLDDPQVAAQLWQYMLRGRTDASYTFVVRTLLPDGNPGNGAFAAGVYAYENTIYLVAGSGPNGSSMVLPTIVVSPAVDWLVFAPNEIQLNMTLTVLPKTVMLSMNVTEVDQSLIQEFLRLFLKVDKTLLQVMMMI
jgi:hypothetical protein